MPHVAVTGAAGFIGRHLVARLRADGHGVVAVDRRAAPAPIATGVTWLRSELSGADPQVDVALGSADAVVHLAGCPGVRGDGADLAVRRLRDNVLAGARVLRTVPAATPLVVASSSSVYGGVARDGRASVETDPLRPRGGYARSKAALEELAEVRAEAGGAVTVVRPFTVAGEWQRPDMALARWFTAARRGEAVEVYGSVDVRRDVTDVRDVVEAIVRILDGDVRGTLNLGTGEARTLRELLDAVSVAAGVTLATSVRPASVVEPRATLADTTRCAETLGFVPRTDLHDLARRQFAAGSPLPDLVEIP